MSDQTELLSEGIDRRTLLTAGGLSAAALAAGVLRAGPAEAAPGGNTLTLDVRADLAGLNFSFYDGGPLAGGNPGPFYIPGTIYPAGTLPDSVDPPAGDPESIGVFHCWGFFFEPEGALGVVSQEYGLDGRGKIQVQGVEDEGPRAVTGGTGDFRNARGEMTSADLGNFPNFTAFFQLIG